MCVHVVGGVRVRVWGRARGVYMRTCRGRLGTRLPAAGAGRLGNTHVPYRVAVCTRLICPTRTGAACARVPARVRACPVLLMAYIY